MADWHWLTTEGAARLADPDAAGRGNNEWTTLEIIRDTQPVDCAGIMAEAARRGVRCNGASERSLYENVAFYKWKLKGGKTLPGGTKNFPVLVAHKKKGGVGARRVRRDAAAGAATAEEALLMAAVEPIAKDRLLTAVRGPEAADALARMIADGRIVAFARTGKLMAAKDI